MNIFSKPLHIFFIFLLSPLAHLAQSPYHDFGFQKSQHIQVSNSNLPLGMPWTGGLNTARFSTIDLNFDGKKDLVAFDRNGNRLLCFINTGAAGLYQFEYAPQYEKYFPPANDWFFLYDYNGDGLEDIFTYSLAGIRVFKNVSTPETGISFIKVSERLESYQGAAIPVNIFASSVEIPAIVDLSGDGCPDILVFHVLGSYLNMHKNTSMEKFGHCDSLHFQRLRYCWGNFRETEESNVIELNIDCPVSPSQSEIIPFSKSQKLHAGSSVTPIDLTGNGVYDLLIGDVDFSGLTALYNSGSNIDAHISSVETNFPSSGTPVDILSMPFPSLVDIDGDGNPELIVAPFDEKSFISKNHNHIWLYNITSGTPPEFQLQTTSFLIEDMLSFGTNAFPAFADFSGNNTPDLLVGNFGFYDTVFVNSGITTAKYIASVAWLKNTGTPANPSFYLQTTDVAGLSSLELTHLYPTLADIDNDGDLDLLIGTSNGSFIFVENLANQAGEPVWAEAVINYQNIQTPVFPAPQLFDLNKDGLIDLIVGSRNGKLIYYQNTGTPSNPVFTLTNSQLGNVNVTDPYFSYYGFSAPHFFTGPQGTTALFVGTNKGPMHYYKNIDQNLEGTFELFDNNLLYIYEGWRSAPAVRDLNNDGFPDMILGNNRGGLNLYMGKEAPLLRIPIHNENLLIDAEIFPNPASGSFFLKINSAKSLEAVKIEIMEMSGKKILETNVAAQKDHEIAIQIPSLKASVYLVIISSATHRLVKKLAVQ